MRGHAKEPDSNKLPFKEMYALSLRLKKVYRTAMVEN